MEKQSDEADQVVVIHLMPLILRGYGGSVRGCTQRIASRNTAFRKASTDVTEAC